jgi:ABC-2 type transport system permease protein
MAAEAPGHGRRTTLRFIRAYLSLNLAAAVEYRGAFIAQAAGMMLNNIVFFIFWALYFDRFGSVGGWGATDIGLLWSIAATSIGLAAGLLGNCTRLATIIVQGQLDYYLGLPRNTLLHVLISRSGMAGWGDVCFGLIAYVLVGRLDPPSLGLYALLVLVSMSIYVAFNVLVGSLGFWLGSAEATAFQAQQAAINFSLYPASIFQGWIRVLLFTVVPAGFISHVPVELLRSFDPGRLALLLGFAVAICGAAWLVFRIGLRRYESGNLVVLRG